MSTFHFEDYLTDPSDSQSDGQQEKEQVKVWIELSRGEPFIGKIYLGHDERLQDLMNNDRKFIPVYKLTSTSAKNIENYTMVILNKMCIVKIEEAPNIRRIF